MRYDDIFAEVGETGLFQGLVFLLICLHTFWGLESISMNFIGYNQPHWCRVPALENLTHQQQQYILSPFTGSGDYDSCRRFELNYSSYTTEDLLTWDRDAMIDNQTKAVDCDAGHVFDQTLFTSTFTSRYDLVCGRSTLSQLISTCYFAGVLIGAVTSGVLSDRIGRKKTIVIGVGIKIAAMFLSTFAPNYPVLVVARALIGIGHTAIYLTQFVLLLEFVGPRYRAWYGTGTGLVFSAGYMAITGVAYNIRDDRMMQLAMTIPNIAFLGYIWVLPESPRWLIINGKFTEAEKILRTMAKVNKKQIPKVIDFEGIRKSEGGGIKQKTCGEMMRYPKMRTRTCIVDFHWFVCSLMYYALSLNSGALYGDLFINNIILGVVEIPANLLCIVCCDWTRMGRRLTSCVSLVIGGAASFIAIPLVLNSIGTGSTALSVIGKAFITMGFSAIYVYSAELFPTEVRSAGMGTASMCARISGMASPYIGPPLQRVWAPMPQLIFGVFSTAAGLMTLALPETLGSRLPDTIEEAENFDGKRKTRVGVTDMRIDEKTV